MMKHLLIIIVILNVSLVSVAQESDKKLNKKQLIEQADYYFFKENFTKALDLYKQILENYPKNHYVQYHSFVAEHLSSGRGSDMSTLFEYEKNEGVTDKFYNYWLGRIHYSRYEFDLAEKHFKAFLDMDVYRTNEIKKETEDRLDRTRKTRAFYSNLNDFEIEPLPQPINSAYDDLSPAFYADHNELLFVSARPNGIEKGQYQVFHSIKANEQFSQPKPLRNLGVFEHNNSKIEVVNNDGRLFMYKNDNGGDLYFSEPLSSGWSNPQEFDSKLRDHLVESHFFINDDETIIYFSAKDDNGKLDLYQSNFNPANDTWSDPLPLPGMANSAYNEDAPFLSHDGKSLYFSSDRPESVGGYDVFKSEIDPVTGLWSKPENMGFPINTIDDEINFQLNEDNISGFFSSNRLHGHGDYDIYFFHKQGKVLATGKVYNKQTEEPLANALVSFHPLKYQDESFDVITDNFGNYSKQVFEEEDFIAVVTLGTQRLHSTQIRTTHDEHHKTFEKDFYVVVPEHIDLETDFAAIYKGASSSSKSYDKLEMMGSKFRSGDKAILNNIYFDLHATTYQQESIPTLEKIAELMKDNPNLNVEIGGHTCNIGSHEANMSVSQARAESVKKYLTTHGVSSNRLITKGYGETQPLASNDDEEGGRELNRRIELRVLQ